MRSQVRLRLPGGLSGIEAGRAVLRSLAGPGDLMTVGDYLGAWLDRQKLECKASIYEGHWKVVISKLDHWFGKLKLPELKRKHVPERLAEYPDGNKTLGNIQSVPRAALADAFDDELIEVNPLAGYPTGRRARRRMTSRTLADQRLR